MFWKSSVQIRLPQPIRPHPGARSAVNPMACDRRMRLKPAPAGPFPMKDKRRRSCLKGSVMTIDLKEAVKPGRTVRFTHFKNGELWYETETGFAFPVPATDVGDATFLATDKAMLFMRWIRKHAAALDAARADQASA
jgi:hypothetical protein